MSTTRCYPLNWRIFIFYGTIKNLCVIIVTWQPWCNIMRCTNHEAAHYTILWRMQIVKLPIRSDHQYNSWSLSLYNFMRSTNHKASHYVILWVLIIRFYEEQKSWSFLLYNVHRPYETFSIACPNTPPIKPFRFALNLSKFFAYCKRPSFTSARNNM
jgi:hypothetical protein